MLTPQETINKIEERIDPRRVYKPYYRLIKEYPGFKGKLGLEISSKGYTKGGVLPIAEDAGDFPEFWKKI